MSKLITTSKLSRFWTNAKSYIDNALLGKADSSHTHDGYAASSHTHAQTDISGLSDALAGKAAAGHTHSEYASSTHTHTPASIGAAASDHTHSQYALASDIPESMDIATDAEIDALFT